MKWLPSFQSFSLSLGGVGRCESAHAGGGGGGGGGTGRRRQRRATAGAGSKAAAARRLMANRDGDKKFVSVMERLILDHSTHSIWNLGIMFFLSAFLQNSTATSTRCQEVGAAGFDLNL